MNQRLQEEQPTDAVLDAKEQPDHDFEPIDNSLLSRLKRRIRKNKESFREKVSKLNFSQWMYLLAFFSLIFTADTQSESTDSFMTAGIIAGIGLIRELWQIFMRIWAHTAGKGFLFVLYAATANFALAISALKINSISGVEPTVFIFTMGFTTLLMLPFWLIMASMLFLGTAILLASFWLIIAGLLRLIRIRLPMHWEDQSFAVTTLILRIILIPTLLWALANMVNPYLQQMDMFDEPVDFHIVQGNEISQEQAERIRKLPRDEVAAALQEAKFEFQLQRQITGEAEPAVDTESDLADLTPEQREAIQILKDLSITPKENEVQLPETEDKEETADLKWLDILIARFIYRFETYPYSACAKKPEQRVLTINENLVFVAERDPAYETGIKFSAMECVPRNSAHEKGLAAKEEPTVDESATQEIESSETPLPAETNKEVSQSEATQKDQQLKDGDNQP